MDTQERSTAAVRLAAERAHDRAGLAYRRGDYHEAVACLRQAYEIDHSAPGLREHLALVRTAERAAVAKLSKARDLGEVADSFGERMQAWLAQRDANRGEPTEPCQTPKGDKACGELGHLYAQGPFCDEHRPSVTEMPENEWEPASSSMATYVPAQKQYRDLSHGDPEHPNPDHECVLPDIEPGK